MSRSLFLFGLFLLLGSCSTTNDVVGHGAFQKRKYMRGWHVDLALRKERPGPKVVRGIKVEPMATRAFTTAPIVLSQPMVASNQPVSIGTRSVRRSSPPTAVEPVRYQRPDEAAEQPVATPGPENEGTERRWNRMALISGVFLLLSIAAMAVGGGEILIYLLTFSFITGVIGLLLAIKHKERGKGIAIAAFAFPALLIALAIAALNAAW